MKYGDLAKTFDNPVNYSERFSTKISSLSKEIVRSVGVEVYHDQDMNYSAAQKISLWADECGNPCDSNSCRFELRFYVSSKVNVFCVIYLVRMYENQWQKLPDNATILPSVESIREKIEGVFFKYDYEKVDDQYLKRNVPDRYDDLDGAPATVFSILFTELL